MTLLAADESLTVDAAPATGAAAPVLLIACGALAREVLALKATAGWDHLGLQCLPALLHNRPERIPDAVRDAIRRGRAAGYGRIAVLYGDCGTGGMLDRVLAEEGVERIDGPHCYAFYSGTDAFVAESEQEFTSFYLTDFLVRQFDSLVIRPLGLDRHPELRDAYFQHYRDLVYLAQTEDAALDRQARAAADRLGLAYRRRVTGYGDLAGFLSMQAAAVPA